ncbi:MAG: phosphatase PAP2 family protein [Patescibacteria group bacterium]|jgi:undecaprenyl-diphosphatase
MSVDALIVVFTQSFFAPSVLGGLMAVFLARVLIFSYVPILAWLWAYGSRREKHAVKEALWSVGVAILIAEIISLFILRFRPYLAVPDIIALIPPPLTSSFPSIHTSIAIAATAAVYAVNKQWGQLCLLVALGVAIGRIAAGVHYPTDILGGMLVGVGAFILVRVGHRALRKKQS